MSALSLVLLLLGASVFAVVLFRRFNLPPVLGYLAVGSIIGPHALNLMTDIKRLTALAEFGVVFLMFSIGLEFSLSKLYAMKRIVFGLGLLQVLITMLAGMGITLLFGFGWQLGIALGAVLAMSSTAVLTKLLAERMELDAVQAQFDRALQLGRRVFEVLLHGGEADELGVLLALVRNEVVDGGDSVGSGCHGMHDEVRDGRAVLR